MQEPDAETTRANPHGIPKKLSFDAPADPGLSCLIHGEIGTYQRVLICKVDEPEWAAEIVRRWNSFVSRNELIEDARTCAADMRCNADEVEEESAPTVASEYRKVALVLTNLAGAYEQDLENFILAEKGAEVIAAVQDYMDELEHTKPGDVSVGRLSHTLIRLRNAWTAFRKVEGK